MRTRLLLCLLFVSILAQAQSSVVRQAQARMQKGRWDEAKTLLSDAIEKDTANPEFKFAIAQWFYSKGNKNRQLDSAYLYCMVSINTYSALNLKQKERLQRSNLDSTTLDIFRATVDSANFEMAKQINSEESYQHYLQLCKDGNHRTSAIELINEIGYLQALRVNTWKGFKHYLNNYPGSPRTIEATKRYEKLLYEDKTRDHKLESYEAFIQDFATSPFIADAERHVYVIRTAIGTPTVFKKYIDSSSANRFKQQARNILFHLLLERDESVTDAYLTDSLHQVLRSQLGYWVPFLHQGKFGFLDSAGTEVMTPQFTSIDESYRCGIITSSILNTNEGLVSRQGKRLGQYLFSKDIGFGFLKVGDSACYRLFHKSGRMTITSCHEDYQIIGSSFVAAKSKGYWGLYTFTGIELVPPSWEAIKSVENCIVFSKLGKNTICSTEQIASIANGITLSQELVFDEVRSVGLGSLLVRNGALEGIINDQLVFTVPLARQSLSLSAYGMVRKVNDQYLISGVSESLEKSSWNRVSHKGQWLLLQKDGKENLFDLSLKKIVASNSDSVWYEQGLAFVKQNDSIRIYINSKTNITIPNDFKLHFIKSKDSVQFFFTEQKSKKTIFEIKTGAKLFVTEFDRIESFGSSLFLITRQNKVGLLSRIGKILLPIEYDAIVRTNDQFLSLFKDKKFGLFDFRTNRLVKPLYERNVTALSGEVLVTFKDKYCGLVGWDGKPLTKFEFDEIQYWKDSQVWVRKNNHWQLIDFTTNKVTFDKVTDFQFISNSSNEKVAVVHRENLYGVISSHKGIIIPATLSSIVNVGSAEHPFYFTDKEVKEAGVHVVIYYNKDGKFIRKQVYEEEEYERIFCEEGS